MLVKLEKKEHSILSPSKMELFLNCPYGVILNNRVKTLVSEAMAKGTLGHHVAEQIYKRRYVFDDEYLIDGFKLKVDNDMYSSAMDYVNEIKKLCSGRNYFLAMEKKLTLRGMHGEVFGYPDCVIVSEGEILIIDYKTGENPVYVKDNKQLMTYMLGAIDQYGEHAKYTGVIIQPRSRNGLVVDKSEYSKESLDELREQIHDLYRICKNPKEMARKKANWKNCEQCNMKTICDLMYDSLIHETIEGRNMDNIEYMAQIVKAGKLLKKYVEDCEKNVLQQSIDGSRFNGLKLVKKTTQRRWIQDHDMIIDELTKKYGFNVSDISEIKLMPIKKVRDNLTKEDYEEVEKKLTWKPDGDLTVVPEHDRRKEAVDEFRECFDKAVDRMLFR